MGDASTEPKAVEKLQQEYELYDRSVDVVSAFQWFFTQTKEMPSVVRYFDRYPRVSIEIGDETRIVTPDFVVLFNDGTAWIAEIANIALHDNSVEKLCSQLANYALVAELRDGDGHIHPVTGVDVVFLSPIATAADAARRVFTERLDEPSHWYKPTTRPILVQFAQEPERYVFQPWPDKSINGAFHAHGEPGEFTSMAFSSLAMRPNHFASNKVQFAFCNDPIPPLYLATRLMLNVFPTLPGVWGEPVEATTEEIVTALQAQYLHGLSVDVVKAMTLLKRASFVTSRDNKSWRILPPGRLTKSDDLHLVIARRAIATDEANKKRAAQSPRAASQSTALFESPEQLEALLDGDAGRPKEA